jgi:hypothetical protein
LVELEESATSAAPHESNETVPLVAFDVPTELKVVVADSTVEVVISPVGRGEPEHTELFVLTVPPLPEPVEKQFTLPGVCAWSCSVPTEKRFALLMP